VYRHTREWKDSASVKKTRHPVSFLYNSTRMNANRVSKTWASLCPPAQIFPIAMTALVLFDLYRGAFRYAISHLVALVLGTVFLWILCAAKLEFAAYALLLVPVLFVTFVLAIIVYDQTLLSIKHRHKCGGCGRRPCEC